MKSILILLVGLFSISSQAQSLRLECENAYHATGYVKYRQYKVIVSWEQISDHAHLKLENILHNYFKILKTKELEGKTIYSIKEISELSGHEALLEELKTIPSKVSCTYDI